MNRKPSFNEKINSKIEHLMSVILTCRFSDLDADYKACMELLEISRKEHYVYGLAFAYAYLGDCLIGKNESVNASTNLMKAKELCEKNRYLDLLPYVCTWLGIYYEMQNDRQMAMHNYLDALEFAEKNNDLHRQSILLNNIASQFQSCGSYDVAKEYYIKAFDYFNALDTLNIADPHYAQMTANIISVCCRLKQIDEAKHYCSLLEKSEQLGTNRNQLYLCQLLISAAMGDVKTTQQSVEKYLKDIENKPQDVHQFFETLLVVAESMIALNEIKYARQMLTTLSSLCQNDEYGHRLKVQYIWMHFYKLFGTQEEKNKAYAEFYELRQMSDSIINHNLAEGLLSKIKLRESVKKTQEIEKKKELLEDEIQLDELTQLYNRRSFRNLTQQAACDPQVQTLCLVMIDIDYFKQYNDTYGHPAGDKALCAVADILNSVADNSTYMFRYGGDEFVAMYINKSPEEVEHSICTFSQNLQEKQIPHKSSLCSQQLTLSIGYCLHNRINDFDYNIADMMAEADIALYRVKDRGRNGHCAFS